MVATPSDPGTAGRHLLGFGLPQTITLPPFRGSLCMPPQEAISLLFLPAWFVPRFNFGLPVPNYPSLRGVNVLLQSLSGPSLWTLDAGFSNCVAFQIQ